MNNKLRYTIILSLIISGPVCSSFITQHNFQITNYADEFVLLMKSSLHKPPADLVNIWFTYENNHIKYLKEIYWDHQFEHFSPELVKEKVAQEANRIKSRLPQIKWLSKESSRILSSILKHCTFLPCKKPRIHLYLAVSPLPIEAKAQQYDEDPYTIHVNAFHNSFLSKNNAEIVIAHEVFHVLQFQFLDDLGDKIDYDTVWGKLIAEGMATYYSNVYFRKSTPCDVAFMQEYECTEIEKKKAALATRLLELYESSKKEDIEENFAYGKSEFPPRSGYYIGGLISRQLSDVFSFETLASMSSSELKAKFKSNLERIANGSVVSALESAF